jgi:hypothetical protein
VISGPRPLRPRPAVPTSGSRETLPKWVHHILP